MLKFGHWWHTLRANAKITGATAAAGVYAEAQPTVVKLTDSGVRKLVVAVDRDTGPISVEIVVPDPDGFLADVFECAKWVSGDEEQP